MTTTLTFFAPSSEPNKTDLFSFAGLRAERHSRLDPVASSRYRQASVPSDQIATDTDSAQLSRTEIVVKALIAEYLQVKNFRFF